MNDNHIKDIVEELAMRYIVFWILGVSLLGVPLTVIALRWAFGV